MTVHDALLPLIQLVQILIAALAAVAVLGVLGLFGFAAVVLWPEPKRARTTVPFHELPGLDDIAALADDDLMAVADAVKPACEGASCVCADVRSLDPDLLEVEIRAILACRSARGAR